MLRHCQRIIAWVLILCLLPMGSLGASAEPSAEADVQLAALPIQASQVGYGAVTANGTNAAGSAITLWDGTSAAGFSFAGGDTGIGMHAMTTNKPGDGGDAYVDYDISAYPHRLFRALAGVDAANGNASATFGFKVLIDGAVVYSSDMVTSRTSYLDIYALIPEDARTIRLAMSRPADSSGNGGWGDWVNARLVDAPDSELMSIEAAADSSSVEIGKTAGITVTGTSLGKSIAAFASLTYESSNTAVLSVDTQGTVTGVAAGSAAVTVRAELDGMVRTAEVPFTVTEPTTEAAADVHLALLPIQSSQLGYGSVKTNGTNAADKAIGLWDGTSAAGFDFAGGDTGIGMHAMTANKPGDGGDAYVDYDISAYPHKLFRALAGVDAGNGSATAKFSFKVLIDGAVVYSSSEVTSRDHYLDVYALIPEGAATLRLAMGKPAGSDGNGGWGDWVNARLVDAANPENLLMSIAAAADSSSVEIGKTAGIAVTGTSLGKSEVTAFASLTYESSNTAVLSVDAQGTVTGIARGNAAVTVRATLGDISRTAEVMFTVTGPNAKPDLMLTSIHPASQQNGYQAIHFNDGKNANNAQLYLWDGTKMIAPAAGDTSIGMHAMSDNSALAFASYDIAGKGYNLFRAWAGVDPSTQDTNTATATFSVLIDGQVAYASDVMGRRDAYADIYVPIPADAEELTIAVGNGGDGNNGDWANWISARLVDDSDAGGYLGAIVVDMDSPVVYQGESMTLGVQGRLLDGTLVSVSDLDSATYESSNTSVLTVDDTGKMTGVAEGSVIVTVTIKKGTILQTKKVPVAVRLREEIVEDWVVESPSKSIKATLSLTATGRLVYNVAADGIAAIDPSSLGLETSLGSLSSGLVFDSREDQVIDETYSLISGKKSSVRNHANEMTVRFTKDGVALAIVMRAYDDGFAVRYGIEGTGELKINSEGTAFTAPGNVEAFMLPYGSLGAWNEDAYIGGTMQDTVGKSYNMPFLYKTLGETWVLLNEAALSPEYTGSVLFGEAGNVLRYKFSPTQGTANPVRTNAPWVSPWRSAVIGKLGDIVENNLAENLSPAPDPSIDWSFVKPGIAAWLWYVAGAEQDNPELFKQYIDYAADMGWKYMVMDEGWQGSRNNVPQGRYRTREYPDWLKEVAEYAKSKGIGLMAWMHSIDVDTADEREDLVWMIEQGLVGFKLDFFNSTSQATMKLYDDLYKFAAEHKVLLDIHGTNQPTGEIRTYPNVLTREGIRAQEFTGVYSSYNTIYPFTRTAVGPADFNPALDVLKNAGATGDATVSHRLALNVMYESGIPMPSDSIAGNAKFGADLLLKNMPVAWDETHLIDGYPGKSAILSRRSGDDWYVAGISTDAMTAGIPLDFLGAGTYTALVFQDGQNESDLWDMDVSVKTVTAADTLSIPVRKGGGFTVRLAKKALTYADSISLNANEVSMDQNGTYELQATLSPADADFTRLRWSSSDETVAVVDAAGKVTAKAPGEAIITAATGPDNAITAEARITVRQPAYLLTDWTIRNGAGNESYRAIVDENTLTLQSRPGELGEKQGLPVVPNLFVRELTGMAEKNFAITVKVDASPALNYHTAGITIFNGDTSKSVSMMQRYHGGFGGNVFELHALNSGTHTERTTKDDQAKPVYLKLAKDGNVFRGYFSADGESWTEISQTVTQTEVSGADNIYIGLYAINGSGNQTGIPMTFADFKLDGQLLPFAVKNPAYEPVTVTSVTVSPKTAAVRKGATQRFSSAVAGTNAPDKTVIWSVSGNTSDGTTIADGLLTVGADEKANSLTVHAASTADPSKFDTAVVTVSEGNQGGGDGGTGGDNGGNNGGNNGGDNGDDGSTPNGSSSSSEPGGEQQDVGTTSTQTIGGRTVTTIKVDDAKLAKLLESAGIRATVTIAAGEQADAVIGELNGQMIKDMEQKQATLEVKTGKVTYTLPASRIDIDAVSAQLGSQVSLKDIAVSVRIAASSEDTIELVKDAADRNNYRLVINPVEFEIICASGDTTVAVSRFNGYVERTIALPDGIDPSGITTGVVLNEDGTFRHVPTRIIARDGRYYAVISSLTNSVYSAIWNPVEFSDMTGHWAADAVNDMGSRLVVSGVGDGSYAPGRSITRAEFAAIMVRAMGLAPSTAESGFHDVSLGDWFNGYVDTASSYKLISGYDTLSYAPNDTITREQAMTIMARAIAFTGLDASLGDSEIDERLAGYSDAADVSDYARASVALCLKTGLVTGKSAATIAPKDAVTRAEVAVMVQRLLNAAGLI
ncbi:glycoside hydrolase family 97 catalytic domain-containing protein [Cohnella fermenti]|uniref:SLH domain-containing protein n=1 Tax=Cohnella fermenti TaxID=2565925 RepID=A0A4S4BRF8_9BACL|nr:glycoside hydrolase family 97 catalytic domain-containing protein [Cohnella fermenti]THF77599.1 hypothetical protein E6C55_16415 [Cohnella fermenti]